MMQTELAVPARETALVSLLGELGIDPSLLLERVQAEGRPAPTIDQAIVAWRAALAVGKSPATIRTYATGLRRFVDFLVSIGVDPKTTTTADIPADSAERFACTAAEQFGSTGQTLVVYLSALRSFYRFLAARRLEPRGVEYGRLRLRLAELTGGFRYRSRRIDRRLPKVVAAIMSATVPAVAQSEGDRPRSRMTAREQQLMLLRDRALLLCLWSTGARVAELLSLDRQDVDDGRADQAMLVGKGRRERVVFFDGPTLAAVRAYLVARADTREPLFLRHNRRADGGRLQPQSAWLRVRAYGAALGIPCSPHHLRHLKACSMLNRGATMAQVQAVLGHASIAVTSTVYAKYDIRAVREAFDRYSTPLEELLAESSSPDPAA